MTTQPGQLHERLTTGGLPSTLGACPGSSPVGIVYSYDPASNLTGLCDQNTTTTYTYDAANRFTGLAPAGASCTPGAVVQPCTTYGYNNADQLTTITYPTSTGVVETLTPNNSGQVTSLVAAKSGTTLDSLTYSYEQAANDRPLLQSVRDNITGVTTTYGYTTTEQLHTAAVSSGGAYTYSYDPDSDLTAQTNPAGATTALAYNAADELCWTLNAASANTCTSPPTGATTYTYDADGNQTGASNGLALSYNSLNQTTKITPTCGCSETFTYLGAGQAQRYTAGTTTFANSVLGVDTQTSGTNLYFSRTPTGQLANLTTSGATSYYVSDPLGTVLTLVSSTGTVTGSYSYDPLGNITASSGSQSVTNPFAFQSGYRDQAGFSKFGQRYYDPTRGRWTQLDPSGQNLTYVFAGDDPSNFLDPSGEELLSPFISAVTSVFSFLNPFFPFVDGAPYVQTPPPVYGAPAPTAAPPPPPPEPPLPDFIDPLP